MWGIWNSAVPTYWSSAHTVSSFCCWLRSPRWSNSSCPRGGAPSHIWAWLNVISTVKEFMLFIAEQDFRDLADYICSGLLPSSHPLGSIYSVYWWSPEPSVKPTQICGKWLLVICLGSKLHMFKAHTSTWKDISKHILATNGYGNPAVN